MLFCPGLLTSRGLWMSAMFLSSYQPSDWEAGGSFALSNCKSELLTYGPWSKFNSFNGLFSFSTLHDLYSNSCIYFVPIIPLPGLVWAHIMYLSFSLLLTVSHFLPWSSDVYHGMFNIINLSSDFFWVLSCLRSERDN